MVRYFLALLPPEAIQEEVLRIQQTFAKQYHSRKALNSPPHITLQAPFDWPSTSTSAAQQTTTALAQGLAEWTNHLKPLPIQLSGFGVFAPRVIYVHVQCTPALLTLHTQLQTYCAEVWNIKDTRSQHRPFIPHITVAFRDLTRANFHASWPHFQDRPFEHHFTVTALTLLKHNSQRWETFSQFAFGS